MTLQSCGSAWRRRRPGSLQRRSGHRWGRGKRGKGGWAGAGCPGPSFSPTGDPPLAAPPPKVLVHASVRLVAVWEVWGSSCPKPTRALFANAQASLPACMQALRPSQAAQRGMPHPHVRHRHHRMRHMRTPLVAHTGAGGTPGCLGAGGRGAIAGTSAGDHRHAMPCHAMPGMPAHCVSVHAGMRCPCHAKACAGLGVHSTDGLAGLSTHTCTRTSSAGVQYPCSRPRHTG